MLTTCMCRRLWACGCIGHTNAWPDGEGPCVTSRSSWTYSARWKSYPCLTQDILHADTEICLPWRGLVVVAASPIDGTHAGSSGAAGWLCPAQPMPPEECAYLVLPSTWSGQNPNFGRTLPRGPKHSHCDKPRKGHFIPAKQRNANEP